MPRVCPCALTPERAGKDIVAVGEYITARKFAETLREVTGKDTKFEPLSEEAFHAMGKSDNPYVKELYMNFKYFIDDVCVPLSRMRLSVLTVAPGSRRVPETSFRWSPRRACIPSNTRSPTSSRRTRLSRLSSRN